MTTAVELDYTDPLHREINTGLMIRWINADLAVRAVHDVRYSTVLYDEDKLFTAALPASVDMTEDIRTALRGAGIHFYSRGIV